VVVVRVPPLSPRGGGCPRGAPLDPHLVQDFQFTSLPSEGQTRLPSKPQKEGECPENSKDLICEPLV